MPWTPYERKIYEEEKETRWWENYEGMKEALSTDDAELKAQLTEKLFNRARYLEELNTGLTAENEKIVSAYNQLESEKDTITAERDKLMKSNVELTLGYIGQKETRYNMAAQQIQEKTDLTYETLWG